MNHGLSVDVQFILDNVLRVGERLEINTPYRAVHGALALYRYDRKVPKGAIVSYGIERGSKARIWKMASGYEKPDQ